MRQLHKDLQNRHYVDWLSFLERTEKWTREEIESYQLMQLKAVLAHAYGATPGYRRLFDDAGCGPSTVRTLADIGHFPFVTKETLRDNLREFTACKDSGATYVTTGGSTGIPFGFYRDEEAFARELASKAHQYHRIGWREGDPQLVLRGIPIDTVDHTEFLPEFNELRCSSYYLTPEWMEAYRLKAMEYGPEWLRCYPSSGYIFATFMKESGRPFPPLKGILCASENLYDFQKNLLADVFRCRVFSHYGHYELAALAGFCEDEDAYHVLPQYGYVELLDRNGRQVTNPGEMGEIVATSFIMKATPFIRYRTRDFAVLKGWGCPSCGRPYQVWERVEGRMQDFIVTAGGRLISMTAINMHDDIFDDIAQFQFFQETKGKVLFRYIPKDSCSEASLKRIRTRLAPKLGTDTELSMARVDSIPPTKRGKHRFLEQKLELGVGDV